jgi:hypothetical protein
MRMCTLDADDDSSKEHLSRFASLVLRNAEETITRRLEASTIDHETYKVTMLKFNIVEFRFTSSSSYSPTYSEISDISFERIRQGNLS